MSLHLLRSAPRSKWNPTGFALRVKVCQRFLFSLGLFVFVCVLLVVHTPSRNTLLHSVWPRMWMDVGTGKILKMRAEMRNIEVGSCADVRCENGLYRPIAKRKDVESRNVLFYDSEELSKQGIVFTGC